MMPDTFEYSVRPSDDQKTIDVQIRLPEPGTRSILIECLRYLADHLEKKDEREEMN